MYRERFCTPQKGGAGSKQYNKSEKKMRARVLSWYHVHEELGSWFNTNPMSIHQVNKSKLDGNH